MLSERGAFERAVRSGGWDDCPDSGARLRHGGRVRVPRQQVSEAVSDAVCTCVRVGARRLLSWPETEEGPRGYLFQAGQGKVPRASWLRL